MPFGISSAPEIFHRAMESIIEGDDGVRVYVDDIVLWGSTLPQHNERLTKLSEFGVEPDRAKVQAILDMPRPTDKKADLRVMGMINFIGKFIPNLSSRTMHLRELVHHANEFKWTAKHETEWESLKTILTTEPVLTFFDLSKRTKISTDASKNGLGAVLLQATGDSWNPVAYASRTMTSSERNSKKNV
uniref:Reverse transcriptase/retrotransposon-derived protein RNase H-like domain-containing protein n=1 Tax=Pygocentrus nattereri TaxID=42514 RepID=A0AAR2KV96_PYGNA